MSGNRFRKLILPLLIIIFLPVAVFIIYELASLNESERVLEAMYKRQLEAMIYSVNQYSEDVAATWVADYENENLQRNEEFISAYLEELSSVKAFITIRADTVQQTILNRAYTDTVPLTGSSAVNNLLLANHDALERLETYRRGGYQKILPLQQGDLALFIFLPRTSESLAGFIVNPQQFIENYLSPKLEAVSQEEFTLSIFTEGEGKPLFSTAPLADVNAELRENLWLLPGYELGIQIKGERLSELLSDRSYLNLGLVLLLAAAFIIGIIVVFRNIRKDMELAEMKSEFISNVSHELRTPLAVISMYAETLEMNRVRDDDKKKEYYRIISNETLRLSKIVNKILSFSKMEAGGKKYSFRRTNINDILQEIYVTYDFHLKQQGFKFRLIAEDNLPELHADGEALSEALINLIDNAVKYSREEKEIIVRTGQAAGGLFLEVEDKGIGIAADQREKIFDKFYRVPGNLVHDTKGTGLGLTLVKQIIDAHQGRITITGAPGEGSKFRVFLPFLSNEKDNSNE